MYIDTYSDSIMVSLRLSCSSSRIHPVTLGAAMESSIAGTSVSLLDISSVSVVPPSSDSSCDCCCCCVRGFLLLLRGENIPRKAEVMLCEGRAPTSPCLSLRNSEHKKMNNSLEKSNFTEDTLTNAITINYVLSALVSYWAKNTDSFKRKYHSTISIPSICCFPASVVKSGISGGNSLRLSRIW